MAHWPQTNINPTNLPYFHHQLQVSSWNVQSIIYSLCLSFHYPVSTDSSLGILGATTVPLMSAN